MRRPVIAACLAVGLILAAAAPAGAQTFDKTSLTFGPQVQGTQSAAQTITLTQNNASLLFYTPAPAIVPLAASGFFETDNCPQNSMTLGQTCTFNVTFYPSDQNAPGTTTATLYANGSGPTATLTGTTVKKTYGKKCKKGKKSAVAAKKKKCKKKK